MPAALPNSIRKCTQTIGRHSALALDVCRAGDRVAIHVHTPRGVVDILVNEAEFVLKCRGRADTNGNPWRPLAPRAVELVDEVPAPPAATSIPTAKVPRGGVKNACEVAFQAWAKTPLLTLDLIAEAHGIGGQSLRNYCSRHRPGEVRRIRAAALAALSEPILKPKGTIL